MDVHVKKVVKRIVRRTLDSSRRVLTKSPRIKAVIKRAVLPYFQLRNDKGYAEWVSRNFPDFIKIAQLHEELKKLQYLPLISIVVPTYNTQPKFLRDCIDSVLGQAYDNWQLCIVDDASTTSEVRDIITQYAHDDARIKYKFLKKNRHIAGATNEAIRLADGEFISLLDHDDLLWPNALFEIVKALNQDETIDFIYTDEDKITEDRFEHLGPFFKPDWNPDFLHSVNYITHFSTIRKSLLDKIGYLRKEYNGAQDWDLIMRVTATTEKIYHIPKVVYSWRIHEESTAKNTDSKPYVVDAQRRAISEDLKRKGYSNALVQQDKEHPGYWHVSYSVQNEPLISIVIPSKNQYKVLKRCIDSIYNKTTYNNFEIVLVDTGSDDPNVTKWYDFVQRTHDNFKVVFWPEKPFSYARSCNEGARQASGELLVMLNNDTEVVSPNWLEEMAGDAQRPEIGIVGCLLFFPDRYHIQHAGVGVGLGGVAANSFSMMTLSQPMTQTQHLMINAKHNMTAVTAACMMMRKELFDKVGGFNEKYRVTYNDVDLCLRVFEQGYQNLYTPYVRLIHHESISVGQPTEIAKRDTREMRAAITRFKREWGKYVLHDPNINPQLSKEDAFYDIPKLNVNSGG